MEEAVLHTHATLPWISGDGIIVVPVGLLRNFASFCRVAIQQPKKLVPRAALFLPRFQDKPFLAFTYLVAIRLIWLAMPVCSVVFLILRCHSVEEPILDVALFCPTIFAQGGIPALPIPPITFAASCGEASYTGCRGQAIAFSKRL
eukprot:scaffold244993_cov28-Tisochrysis_lutea.AAC.3